MGRWLGAHSTYKVRLLFLVAPLLEIVVGWLIGKVTSEAGWGPSEEMNDDETR